MPPQINIGKVENSVDIIGRDKIQINISSQDRKQDKSEKNNKVVKIKIDRYLADYKLNIEEIIQEYFKESNRIASNMAGRGIARSGIHIKAQMDYAKEIKKKADNLFTKLTRDIEDALLENFGTSSLADLNDFAEEYKIFNDERGKLQKLYAELEDNVRSWETKALGTTRATKDFKL